MRLGEPSRMQSSINITPLVDVVLVLLIIFMVMAPSISRKGPDVNLPNTVKPVSQGDERGRILVSIDDAGALWIDEKQVAPEDFGEALRAAVGDEKDPKVVLKGDSRLNFREVRQAMQAIEQAGFPGIGLIAKRAGTGAPGE
jgi:biopolymer transport protein TolR